MSIKTLQVPVIVGNGEKQILVVSEHFFKPPCPPIFRIKDIEKKVKIKQCKVIDSKVIVSGFIDKNINYKVFKHFCKKSVCGPLFHFTTKVPFCTCIDIIPCEGEEVRPGDRCEILEAFVEGQKNDLRWKVFPKKKKKRKKKKHHDFKKDDDCTGRVEICQEDMDDDYEDYEDYDEYEDYEEYEIDDLYEYENEDEIDNDDEVDATGFHKKHKQKWYRPKLKPPPSFRKLIEKDCVKIVAKVVRMDHCTVKCRDCDCELEE